MKLRLKEVRKRLKLGQADVAERTGMSIAAIRKYERHIGAVSLDRINQIATALDVNPLVLVSEEAERLLSKGANGVDEQGLIEAIALALEITAREGLGLGPEQIARMAVLFCQAKTDDGA